MPRDSSDLQQRHTAASKKPTKKRTPRSGSATVRRRRRKVDPNRDAPVVAIVFASIAIPVFLIAKLLGKGDSDGRSGASHRSLQNWVPNLKRKTATTKSEKIPSAKDLEAEERAKRREERYHSLYRPKFDESTIGYDIYNCPNEPPDEYPMAWKTTEVLSSWNPNDVTTLPPAHRDVYQGLCIFDYETQYATALNYRNNEKPFIIRNDPKVTSVARRWEDNPDYLHRALGDVEEYRTERSPNNQFMWYRLRGNHNGLQGYTKPLNDEIEMTFGEWLEHAIEKDGKALGDNDMISKAQALKERRMTLTNNVKQEQDQEDDPLGDGREGKKGNDSEEEKQKKYYYFRLNADTKRAREPSPSKFIYDELPFFDPYKRNDSQFYIVDPRAERGINCRFGMRGVTAANHFDMSRNMIAVFGGERRYVLASPTQCSNMALYPEGHPSVRHSSLDWSNPMEWDDHPEFKEALVNEVVLHAGDVLYLPTCWFHYIINLSLNYQCNARSGTTHENSYSIRECGYNMPKGKK